MLSRLAAARRQLLLSPAVAYRSSSAAATASAVHERAAPASASVLPDTLERGSDAYQRNTAAVGGLLSDLRARVSQVPVLTPHFLERALCPLIEDWECALSCAGAARGRRRGGGCGIFVGVGNSTRPRAQRVKRQLVLLLLFKNRHCRGTKCRRLRIDERRGFRPPIPQNRGRESARL